MENPAKAGQRKLLEPAEKILPLLMAWKLQIDQSIDCVAVMVGCTGASLTTGQ